MDESTVNEEVYNTDGSDENLEGLDEDELVVTIGEEKPEKDEPAPEWVKQLRKSHRETQKENRDLKARLDRANQPEVVEVGKKPTLKGLDYDESKYEEELSNWYGRKRDVEDKAAKAEGKVKAQKAEWQETLSGYDREKAKRNVKDFGEVEAVLFESLDQTQQGITIQGAKNAALVFLALKNNSVELKRLSSIKDPVKFAFAVAKLESELKVRNRSAPPPEKTVNGTGPISGTVDNTLERLRAEADKTGDSTKVVQYRREQKAKARR